MFSDRCPGVVGKRGGVLVNYPLPFDKYPLRSVPRPPVLRTRPLPRAPAVPSDTWRPPPAPRPQARQRRPLCALGARASDRGQVRPDNGPALPRELGTRAVRRRSARPLLIARRCKPLEQAGRAEHTHRRAPWARKHLQRGQVAPTCTPLYLPWKGRKGGLGGVRKGRLPHGPCENPAGISPLSLSETAAPTESRRPRRPQAKSCRTHLR